MKLSAKERITLSGVLPPTGNILTLRLVRELREDVSFSEKEAKDIDLKITPEGRATWDAAKEKKVGEKDINITDSMREVISKALQGLSDKEKLTQDHISLWDKFCK
jgi:DNA-binding MarR family transcriptional regulator